MYLGLTLLKGMAINMKYYTGIGSRSTPPKVIDLMREVAFTLAKDGWTLRSGGAQGADQAFEDGVINFLNDKDISGSKSNACIYIPWKGFKNTDIHSDIYVNSDSISKEMKEFALQKASEIHPNWNACSKGAKTLHSRNIFQVVGHLKKPVNSKFVLFYAPISGDSITGGTRTAVEYAKSLDIECINLFTEEGIHRIENYLKGMIS